MYMVHVSCDFCECVYTKRNTKSTHLVYLTLIFFVFPRLCIDVVQFCSKFASCHSAEKAKLKAAIKYL